MLTLIAWSFRPDSTAKQRTAGIEAAVGITDHPPMAPKLRIDGPALLFDEKGYRSDLITTITEPVTMATLKNEKGG